LSSQQIKLLATDLDGTLLDSSGKIPERNKKALAEAVKKGVAVTISTGRMYNSALWFANQLGLSDTPLMCYNGSMIRRAEGETIVHLKLDMDVARRLLAIFRERNMYVQSYIDDVLYVKDMAEEEARLYAKHFGGDGQAIGDRLYDPASEPTKLLAMTEGLESSNAMIKEFRKTFGDRLYVTSSNENFVEMMNPSANKGKCLEKLADILGISMEDILAIGDGENDADMIKCAGIGIAMANAQSSLKESATAEAPSNDECGVAWAVEKYIL
jgi:Cof subfamily protein (haloacid dehalogenase superfamily)